MICQQFATSLQSQCSLNHKLAMITLYTKKTQPQHANTLCVIRYGTNCKPFFDRTFNHSLCVHIFFTAIAFEKGNFQQKTTYEINQVALNFCRSIYI